MQPFIVTLGNLSPYSALALIYTGGTPIFGLQVGCRTLTIGSLAGVPNSVVTVGVLALVARVILIGRLGAAESTLGTQWELDAIAAIGGASLMRGRGLIVGSLICAIILGTLRNGLTRMNVQAFYQLLATKIIIIVAMLVDKLTSGKRGRTWVTHARSVRRSG